MSVMSRVILQFVSNYIKKYAYAPSYREIADGVALKSINSVHRHVRKLIEDGYLETDHPGSPRALRIPGSVVKYDARNAEDK